MFNHAKNELERKRTSPFAKVGRISGQTLRGWLRHAVEKLLLQHGVAVCHPLTRISVTSDRNKRYYEEEDLTLGYHPRGACAEHGGCLVYQMFGDLDVPGNLVTPSVYFYPTTSGDGTATKNINKVFGSIGGGRIEVTHCSPRARKNTHQTYMAIETAAGVMIEAPINLILKAENEAQEIVLLKALEFLKTMVQGYEFDFLLGGMRDQGYGRASILPVVPKARKSSKKKQAEAEAGDPFEDDEDDDTTEEKGSVKIQFKLTNNETSKLDAKFLTVVEAEKTKFPIENNGKERPEEMVEAKV